MLVLADGLTSASSIATIVGVGLAVITPILSLIVGLMISNSNIKMRLKMLEANRSEDAKLLKSLNSTLGDMNTNFALIRQSVDEHLMPLVNTLLQASPPPSSMKLPHHHKH